MSDPKDFVFVERYKDIGGEIVDLGVVDIPRSQLEMTLKQNPLFKVVKEKPTNDVPAPAAPVQTEETGFACPLCPKVLKTETALKTHKTRVHK
jgi:hypothetical protein